jgi:endoglycosylceramidase
MRFRNRLPKIIAAFVGLALPLFCGCSSLSSPADAAPRIATNSSPVGAISHSGRWLTDADGRVVLFHGVNMVEKSAPYYPAAFGFGSRDAAWIQRQGLEVVRLGVLATGLMPSQGHISTTYLDHLASTVATLGRHGVYVLLDLHQDGFGPSVGSDGFPAWMTLTGSAVNTHAAFPDYYLTDPATQEAFQSLWNNVKTTDGVGLQTDIAKMYGALAAKFGGTGHVLGYDVFNEPWPGTTWMACLSGPDGCPTLVTTELDPLYTRVDKAIRAHDHTHLVLVEPFVLFNYGMAPTTVALPNDDTKSGLAFHQYATSPATAQNVLTKAASWSDTTHGALLDTEWGASSTAAAITQQAGQFDHAEMPWIFWSFDGELVKNVAKPPSGANLVRSTVDAVVRPYLSVVGGTPVALHDGVVAHTYVASWSTREPNGRVAPAGTISTIEVPKLDYPHGSSAHVSGGRVTSARCAPVLTVASSSRAKQVTVTVRDMGSCSSS